MEKQGKDDTGVNLQKGWFATNMETLFAIIETDRLIGLISYKKKPSKLTNVSKSASFFIGVFY